MTKLWLLFDCCNAQDVEGAALIEHPGERLVLWNPSAPLERNLVEPFKSDYALLVGAATWVSRSRAARRAVCRSGEQLTVILTDLVALGELMTLNRLRLADV